MPSFLDQIVLWTKLNFMAKVEIWIKRSGSHLQCPC